jgi:DNA processing protein
MNHAAWIALSLTGRIGNKTLSTLLEHFDNNLDSILAADTQALRRVPGIGPKIAQSIAEIQVSIIESALVRWQRDGIRILTLLDKEYPQRLRPLDDAPLTLFVRGDWPEEPTRTVAIIGTRAPSPAAQGHAKELSLRATEAGYTLVSGLAMGIDALTHQSAVALHAGRTIAVLGSGVQNVYPPDHRRLALAVMQCGALISEVQPTAPVSSPTLVARNRIITGMSDLVIVVETGINGGAMYAARFAAQQGRPLYVMESAASGNQALAEQGATVIPATLQNLPF